MAREGIPRTTTGLPVEAHSIDYVPQDEELQPTCLLSADVMRVGLLHIYRCSESSQPLV